MKFYKATVTYCLVLAVFITISLAAEDDYIISEVDDETLLTLSIVFLVVCGVFFLISVVAAIAIIRKAKSSRRDSGYYLEEQEERYQNQPYQSMYDGRAKSNGVYETQPDQYESLKLTDSSEWIYQPVKTNESNGHVNEEAKTIPTTPSGTEKGQKESKENEKHKTLSSFQNPAYESSMPYGLDMKQGDITPDSEDQDTAL